MQIPWAAFGEKNGGHALLAQSSAMQVAKSIVQYTDRPGDPPLNTSWGPVISGFSFNDYYVLLQTLPDPSAGRAGMVRSYAAFLKIEGIRFIQNLSSIFNELPSNIVILPTILQTLLVSDNTIRTKRNAQSGLISDISIKLCSPNTVFPIVLSSSTDYLYIVDSLWANMPSSLRYQFSFAFQFAPEHKLPVPPTIIVTLPSLIARWPSNQVILPNGSNQTNGNIAQECLAGIGNDTFTAVLDDYALEVVDFKALNLLSTFVELVNRLEHLSFADLRKTIRILEKHSVSEKVVTSKRTALFKRFCRSLLKSLPEDIETLRNFNSLVLVELIPPLQNSIRKWLDNSTNDHELTVKHIKILELAVNSPKDWWSKPFIEWLYKISSCATDSECQLLYRIVISSSVIADFVWNRLPSDNITEERLIEAMPITLNEEQSDLILKLAEQRQWMRIHALCLLRTMQKSKAILLHLKVAKDSTAGLVLLYDRLGFIPLLKAACSYDNAILDNFVGDLILRNIEHLPANPSTHCPRWPVLLDNAMRLSGSLPKGQFRDLIIEALNTSSVDQERAKVLLKSSYTKDISILLDMEKPSSFLDKLDEKEKEYACRRLNDYISDEIKACRRIQLINPEDSENFIDPIYIFNTLNSIPIKEASKAGANTFRSFPCFTDSQCKDWLVNLFTRTTHFALDNDSASSIADLLKTRNFPLAAKIIFDTVEIFKRKDVAPILESIRSYYPIIEEVKQKQILMKSRLPKVLIATAIELERTEVLKHLGPTTYDVNTYADIANWPTDKPIFEVYLLSTGAGNLQAMQATHRLLEQVTPKFAFFLGIGGGIKDSEIGDVTYSTKVYYTEGGKEENNGLKSRPESERTSEALIQLAHRVARLSWQPITEGSDFNRPKATPAVLASGEKVIASTSKNAANYQAIKSHYNDSQIIDMESFGFLKALEEKNIYRMIVRGVSDKLQGKGESDLKGNQPLAAKNAAAFLFALLKACPDLGIAKKRRKSK